MTKSILIDRLCEARKVPPGQAEEILNAIFDSIEAALNRGERIEIRGFGSFELRKYRGYVGRNPRTGSAVDVKPKRLPFFKVGKDLKDRVERGARREQMARGTHAPQEETAAKGATARPAETPPHGGSSSAVHNSPAAP